MVSGIKAIISDLGGVLIHVNKQPFFAKLAEHTSMPFDEIADHFSSKVLTGFDRDFGKGLISPKRFYQHAVEEMSLKGISFGQFSEYYCKIFSRKEEVIRFLRELGKKYVIALLSNTDALHHEEWLKLLGSDIKMFRHVVLSFEEKCAKPDPKIYLAMLGKLGLKPKECVYIDDIPEYAEGASKLGIRGICFVSSLEQLEKDLKNIGVTL